MPVSVVASPRFEPANLSRTESGEERLVPDNKGCVFELQSLVAHVPLGKIMLLTDATTDVAFLRQTLDTCWCAVERQSARAREAGSLVLLDTKGRDPPAVDTLMVLADEAF